MRCLVIEDDPEMASYVGAGLAEAGYTVVPCNSAEAGMRMATGTFWDVVILDRMLPGKTDGLAIVEALRGGGNATPVLVLSALAALDERVKGLRGGADDYLTKPFAMPELLARVEALVRRATLREDVFELWVGDLKLDMRTRKAERGGIPIALPPREFRLLEYLARNQGQIVTRAMLLKSVWDYDFDPETNVIDVQISRLRQRIDKDFDKPLLHTVRGIGYILGSRDAVVYPYD